ncbi:MAG: glycosyltransferase family 4 protein [Verrucomicrobiota bacterium]
MRITIVGGFFLPVSPVHGGAMEKMWWRISRLYARRGHEVTLISRRCPGLKPDEVVEGVRLVRVPGFDHRRRLWQNLLLDACWGWRVLSHLPQADILITNTVVLPVFVRALRPQAGLLVVNLNRYPKGQVRWYARAARIQAASRVIAEAAASQAPRLARIIRHVPNPVDCSLFTDPAPLRATGGPLTIGFMGRIHPEKGLLTLVEAASRLARQPDLPAWRLVLRGPTEISKGGGGDEFVARLRERATGLWRDGRLALAPALNDPVELARAYRELDAFCYPTEAATGEAHPVAVLEAMAAGLPVVATDLPCFADQLRQGANALLVPPGDAAALATALARLLRERGFAAALGRQARETVWVLDDATLADQHLADYETLLHARSTG